MNLRGFDVEREFMIIKSGEYHTVLISLSPQSQDIVS